MQNALKMVQEYYPEVTGVSDAKKGLVVSVIRSDCKRAKPESFTDCAFALACKREFDGAIITLTTAYLVRGTRAYRYKIHAALSREITVLDRTKDGDRFKPTTYKLNAPSPSNLLGPRKYDDKRKGRHRPTGRRLKPVHTEDVRNIKGY